MKEDKMALPHIRRKPKDFPKLNKGDTIRCSSWEEAKAVAADLAVMGYKAEAKGWNGIRHNVLTITGIPKEEKNGRST